MTTNIPQAHIDHILNVFQDLSTAPHTLDVANEIKSSPIKNEALMVMFDDCAHAKINFMSREGQAAKITSVSIGMYTDTLLICDMDAFPEVSFQVYPDSQHSLSWADGTDIEDIITLKRMKGLLHIVSRMKDRMEGLFDDPELL